jgi:phosphoribosylformimino-5-aminoimidazole carboxamide ribotide isomerase
MYVIPAIDLIGGKCVRLLQGRYDRQITYRDDPLGQAQEFQAVGAQWLHIVDLEGAKAGRPVNTDAIKTIIGGTKLQVELGGGIRDEDSIRQMLDAGLARVIIGTKAVSDFDWFSEMAEKFAGKIVLGLDAHGSKVAVHGWTEDSRYDLLEFAIKAAQLPIAAIIYTDIAKDGMLEGPNIERTKELAEAVDVPVIASGGVKELDDIKKLNPIGVEGVIVGRSLYEGTLDLAEAIEAAAQGS